MKLILLILMLTVAQASATVYSQKITLRERNAPVENVFRTIEKQTGYVFFYNSDDVRNVRISVSLSGASVTDALDRCFDGLPLTYKIIGSTIAVKKKTRSVSGNENNSGVLLPIPLPPSNAGAAVAVSPKAMPISPTSSIIRIAGTVSDSKGETLPGVSIVIKGTQQGTVTDDKGAYALEVPDQKAVLVFSFVGYMSQEMTVGNQTTLDVTLNVDEKALEEVVVVGYGTQRRSDLTGSVASADLQALKGSPNVSVLQGLQGTVPGLNIGMVDEAGENPSVSIRGRTSISGSEGPLIILDGIIYYGNLSSLNPNDIKSIDVLKDASSKAIYGAQAANGVILITTKKGQSEQKPLISYGTSYSIGSPYKVMHSRNRESYLNMVRDIFWNTAYTKESGYLEPDPNFNILTTPPFTYPIIVQGYESGVDTDWWKLGTTNSSIQRHNVGIQGASARTNYFLSLSFDKQQNYIINDKFNRKTARINLETTVTDWLKVGTQTFGSFADFSGESPNVTQLSQSGPLRFPYDENGKIIAEFGGMSNPLIPINNQDRDRRNEIFGNLYARLSAPFAKGLTLTTNYGNTLEWYNQFNSNRFANAETGTAQKYNRTLHSYTFDNILNYVREIGGKNSIDLTLVVGRTHREFESTTARAQRLSNQTLGYNDLSQGINQFTTSESWEESSAYQMFRLNYAYNSKYYVTGTIRRDGFSGFARNEKTGYFPSVAFGWNVSDESFLKPVTWVDLVKLRASYGVNGNLVARYSSLARVNSVPAYVFGDGGQTEYGHAPGSLPNENLKWEKTHGINAGVDFGFLKNRLRGSLEYYETTTRDLIWNKALPILTGFDFIIDNIGEVRNRGVEVTLNASVFRGGKFSWDVTGNFSQNRNRVTRLLGDVNQDGKEDDLVSSNLFIGEPIAAVFNYQVDGIYQLDDEIPAGYFAGSYKINDVNQDGVLSAADRKILGMTDPLYRFSIHNTFSYGRLNLKVFINSIQGGKRGYLGANEPFASLSPQNISQNGIFEEVDFWTPARPNARFRSPSGTSSINPNLYESRSFVRLQDVILSYDFGKELLSKAKVTGLNVFISGKNLLTLTKWNGWDPETGSGINYSGRPTMKYFTLGLELTL